MYFSGPWENILTLVLEKLVNLNRPINIVETGTMWCSLEENMGAFTYVFGDLIKISQWIGKIIF